MDGHLPTSALLDHLLDEAPHDHVNLAWVLEGLRERSFGLLILLLGLLALMPGLSPVAGIFLIWPAVQMIQARRRPSLPRWIVERPLPTKALSRIINRSVPVLRWLERIVRPRWRTPFESTKRVVGVIILLLALTLFGPVPLSQVLPALAIMLVAFAYLEEDGLMLSIALGTSILSLAVTAATLWGAVAGIDALDRAG